MTLFSGKHCSQCDSSLPEANEQDGSVSHFPEEDSKLRADNLQVRRGGNCPNTLEVLQQLQAEDDRASLRTYLVSTLPAASAPATEKIIESFGSSSTISFEHCLYRDSHSEPASSYIIRSSASGSRTIVNYNGLPEMTVAEFGKIAANFKDETKTWWHFEA